MKSIDTGGRTGDPGGRTFDEGMAKKTTHRGEHARSPARRRRSLASRKQADAAMRELLDDVRSNRDDSIPVGELRTGFGLSREKFGRLVGYSVRAIAGWEGGERKPGAQARRRLAELSRFFDAMSGIVRKEAIPPWMERPNASLGDLKPIEVIERGHIDRLWRIVYELETGAFV